MFMFVPVCTFVSVFVPVRTSEVSSEVFKEEAANITEKFMNKYADHEIEEDISRGQAPLDVSKISCFRSVMMENQKTSMLKTKKGSRLGSSGRTSKLGRAVVTH